jgi:hypothetical protein
VRTWVARAYAREFGIPYGGGLYFPLHVFIDAAGIVRIYHPGEMSRAQVDGAIRSVLGKR